MRGRVSEMASAEQLVLELIVPEQRENALLDLSKVRMTDWIERRLNSAMAWFLRTFQFPACTLYLNPTLSERMDMKVTRRGHKVFSVSGQC